MGGTMMGRGARVGENGWWSCSLLLIFLRRTIPALVASRVEVLTAGDLSGTHSTSMVWALLICVLARPALLIGRGIFARHDHLENSHILSNIHDSAD